MKNQDLILLDLFSGMGGFHLGLEEAGLNFKKVYFSEVDKHAIANYKYNFNEAEHIGSVEHILDSGIERPNIITFGSPCQDFSLAGKRKGLGGDRSSLIEYAISSISHFRPDIYIWENVKGTFSSNAGEDFWAIIQAFANIGGYELEWQLVNTSWILPQNRERVYLVGHLTESFRDWQRIFPIEENDIIPNKETRNEDWKTASMQTSCSRTITSRIFKMGSEDTCVKCRNIAGCLTGGGNSGGLHSDMDVVIHQRGRGKLKDNLNEICPTITSNSFEQNHSVRAVLTPDRANKRQNGRRMKEDGEPSFTITSQDIHGVDEDDNIRRLTEIECERLQGFPDDWTKWGNYDGEVKQISKTQRYKMCGNAVTAKKVANIGRRIKVNFK